MLRFLFCSLYFIPQSHLKIQKFHPPGFDGPAHGASLKHMPYRSALRFSAEWENLRRKELLLFQFFHTGSGKILFHEVPTLFVRQSIGTEERGK